MVASQEDEGATRRIQELERRGALMEHGAQRIFERGEEIRGEYKDEVHHLQGLLGNTEVRLQELQQTNVLTSDVANRLYTEGQEMQTELQNSIVEFRNRSEMATSSNNQLELVSQQQHIAVRELSERNHLLGEALVQSRKQAELYENSMEEITRESRKKVFEANQAKIESEMRHRATEHDTVKRITSYRNMEAEAISHMRLESQASSNAILKAEHYEELYTNEQRMNCELKDEIKFQNEKLRKSLTQGPTTIGRGPSEANVEDLRNQAKIAQIRVQDLGHEVHEYLQENILLREKLSEVADVGTSSFSNTEVQSLKSELDAERKMKLASGAQHYERSCAFMGEIQDRDEKIGIKNSEIIDMKRHIDELRKDLKNAETSLSRIHPNDLPYSAGINHHGLASRLVIDKLENEISEANSENNVLRSWVSQVGKELDHETNVALYYRGRSDPTPGPSSKQEKKITDLLKEVDNRIADGTEKEYYQKPNGGGGGPPDDDDPFGPFGPGDPGQPPDPPGLPSVRGSQRDSVDDISTAAYTAEEPPRVSRREADKVIVSPWPKQQNLGVWQSDLVKSVVLAANDGDRAAWEAWLQHATRPNPDIDALNDSGGQRFQSIDAKLSIALSNVITQAGDVARHVAIKLRLRTQQHSRRGTYVMGREILAMILEHFRTPGQRETAFTMEHIVSTKYLGDQNLEVFYEKWMEMVSNMMPDDVPPDDWLRDSLYKKIRNSNLMMFDIKQYESWMEGDPRRSYRYLLDVIERHISRIREDKHVAAREKYAREFAGGGKPSAPAPNPAAAAPDANPKAKPKATPKEKAAPKAKAKAEAAPVLPTPQPKQHAKGKGKGKGKSKSRSASPRSKKKIPCHFHFIKKACRKGKDCEFSHDQKVFDANKNPKGGGGKPGTPRSQSPANKTKKNDEHCWHWARGKCRYGDKCNKRHDQALFNTAPNLEATAPKATPALIHDWDDYEEIFHKVASNVIKKKVGFDDSKNCIMKYEKKDFVKCDRKSQTIPKGHGKVGISTEKLRQDEQWAYSCRLAASRGKAMAILIDEKGEFGDIDEVLVVVGPKFDILIKFDVEDDEITREVFVENYVQHVEGRYGKRGNTMCITVPVEERDKRFILDSGSGHDLISSTRISRMDLPTYDDKTVNFHTANGVTSSTKRSSIPFDAFNEPAEAHILEDTPSVISMGKRCVDLGYSFVWPAGKTPFMLDSNGNIIDMAVKDYIPYVSVDQEKRRIRSSCVEKIIETSSEDLMIIPLKGPRRRRSAIHLDRGAISMKQLLGVMPATSRRCCTPLMTMLNSTMKGTLLA